MIMIKLLFGWLYLREKPARIIGAEVLTRAAGQGSVRSRRGPAIGANIHSYVFVFNSLFFKSCAGGL